MRERVDPEPDAGVSMPRQQRNFLSFIIAALLLTSLAGLFWGCQTKPAAGDLEKDFVNPRAGGAGQRKGLLRIWKR
jgi:hypothetical protein